MKKISLLILSMAFILGFAGVIQESTETNITSHDCIEAENMLKDTLKAGEDFAHIKISVKVFLAGPFNEGSGLMNTTLFTKNYLPDQTNDSNFFDWFYPKQKKWINFSSNCFNPNINIGNNAFVDYVQVILAEGDPYDSTVKLHWRLARLNSDGSIRSFDDKNDFLKFYLPENKDYYVIVVHRNHNGIMSSIPIRGSGNYVTTYDFTSDVNKIWGGFYGSIQIAGKWCMIPGDGAGAYQNGWDNGKGEHFTDFTDKFMCFNDVLKHKKGYFCTDYNGDGIVDYADVELAEMYWAWGSAIPYCIPTGTQWGNIGTRKISDYNMNGRIDNFDKNYHSFAQRNPFVFPTALDYNMDGIFDIKDRIDARNKLFSITENPVLLPTYRLDGRIIQANNDSLSFTINLKATSNERFEFKASQFFINIDTTQFSPLSASVSGDFSYNNPTILPSGILGMLVQVPNNGTVIISDTGNGTTIAKVVVKGQRRAPGNSQLLATWRNGPTNPFTKIFALVDSNIVDITTSQTHFFVNTATSVGGEEITSPEKYTLSQNYPNPFNPNTVISFTLPQKERITLKVFDITGKEVATLVNEVKTSGYYTVTFNASNLPSGAYFYRLEAGSFIETKKMLLIK